MSKYTVTTSAELMENYIQADFLLPQDKFIALQTNAGASLLFSIGTGGVFYLTMESPGETSGWRQVNLGAAQIKADFGGKATVKTFGAAQAVASQSGGATQIHLGMVINDGTSDHLYLSLNNSDSDLAWIDQPAWTKAPFNAVDGTGAPITPPSPFQIANVLLSEASDGEYIVVDIVRNPGQAAEFITRFYIDTTNPSAPKWMPHDLAIDVRTVSDDSCLGRTARAGGVDGIYTKGFVGQSAQFVYTPLYNAIDPTMPPLPSRLHLPGQLIPDAIAAARNADNTSDLYAAAQGSLYWFASGNQRNDAVAIKVATSPLLAAVRSLYAYTADGAVTVWGLNGNDQVFYLTCPIGKQQTAGAWNVPLTILTDVDAISPFIDRNYNANTFFAHSGTGLVKVVKSPTTGLWSSRQITLPPAATTQAATAIHSYTTHIQVTDANGQSAPNVPVTLTATNVTSVYVNHLYYLIGPSPIQLTTDAFGTITIVELTSSLTATRYQVSVASQNQIPINTMDTAWQRNSKYTTTESLQAAKIVNRDGTTRDFVPTGTSPQALQSVAASNQALNLAYANLSSSPAPPAPGLRALAVPRAVTLETGDALDGVLVDLGDLLSWLASGIDALVEVFKDVANDIWYVIVTIGDAVYHAVLDCVEAVVAAATWIYNAIKIAVEDVIKFLEFLFGWQDILTTHKVLKNVFLCVAQSAVDGIETAKTAVHTVSADLQAQINAWAGLPDFNQTASATVAANPPPNGQNSAPANLGVHHFQGSAASASSSLSPVSPAEQILNDLVNLMEQEGDTLAAAANAVKTQIIDQFSTLSATDIIKKLVAIVADTVIQSTENVLETALDVFAQLVQGAIDLLTAKLDIPVLSWLYHELTGEDLSFLDVICLIAAIPVTIVYKAATLAATQTEKAPFPEGDPFTNGLLAAKNWSQIQAQFYVTPKAVHAASAGRALAVAAATPVLDEDRLKVFSFTTGIISCVGTVVVAVVTTVQRGISTVFDKTYLKTLSTIGCVGTLAYLSPNYSALINVETNTWYADFTFGITSIGILKSMASIPAAAYESDNAKLGLSFIQSFAIMVRLVPTIANIVYHKDEWDTTYKSLIPEAIGNFAFDFAGMLEFPIVLLVVKKGDPKAIAVLTGIQITLMATYSVCMTIAGGIYLFVPGQVHTK